MSVSYNDWLLFLKKVSSASVECVKQQEYGADANHRTQNERVPPLAQIDFLDETVDGGETI